MEWLEKCWLTVLGSFAGTALIMIAGNRISCAIKKHRKDKRNQYFKELKTKDLYVKNRKEWLKNILLK